MAYVVLEVESQIGIRELEDLLNLYASNGWKIKCMISYVNQVGVPMTKIIMEIKAE